MNRPGGREIRRPAVRLEISGEIDLARHDEVIAAVAEALRSGPERIELDLSEVSFLDCAGLRGILAADRLAVDAGCQLDWVSPSPAVRRLLQLTNTEFLID